MMYKFLLISDEADDSMHIFTGHTGKVLILVLFFMYAQCFLSSTTRAPRGSPKIVYKNCIFPPFIGEVW